MGKRDRAPFDEGESLHRARWPRGAVAPLFSYTWTALLPSQRQCKERRHVIHYKETMVQCPFHNLT